MNLFVDEAEKSIKINFEENFQSKPEHIFGQNLKNCL